MRSYYKNNNQNSGGSLRKAFAKMDSAIKQKNMEKDSENKEKFIKCPGF